MGELAVTPRSTKEIQMLANKMRDLVGCKTVSFPIVHLIEVLAVPNEDGTLDLNYEVLADDKMPGEYATYSPVENCIRIRESVYEGALKDNGRDRFTLAHEVGHFTLHRNQDYRFARVETYVPAYRNAEWQANTFASQLLMPRNLIRGMDVEEVAQRCATSWQAAEIALKK